MSYQECWSVVRVEGGYAAARFGRGGIYGGQWQILGWLQDRPSDYKSAYQHGTAVEGPHGFAARLFPKLR
ncbi:MAG: hypothetical protein AAGD10_04370 [Myxococcota bacterium]